MSEEIWRTSASPNQLLDLLIPTLEAGGQCRLTERQLRLLAVGCVRLTWPTPESPLVRRAIALGERWADFSPGERLANQQARQRLHGQLLHSLSRGNPLREKQYTTVRALVGSSGLLDASQCYNDNPDRFTYLARLTLNQCLAASPESAFDAASQALARLVREIAGEPFDNLALSPAQRTPLIRDLATAAYERRQTGTGLLDPAGLSVLADALEEAGCTQERVLDHLRDPAASHWRGCWAMDLVLRPREARGADHG